MKSQGLRVRRLPVLLASDDHRVILRYLDFRQSSRIRSVLQRAMRIPPRRIRAILQSVEESFSRHHRDLMGTLRENYERAAQHVRGIGDLSEGQKLLVGAHFTMEYSIEAAALFNPSIVPHPDQRGLPEGSVRFLMSLRATGEGHVSSIVFRRGVIDRRGTVSFDPPPRYACPASPVPDRILDKNAYVWLLRNHGLYEGLAASVVERLSDPFPVSQLRGALRILSRGKGVEAGFRRLSQTLIWMAVANYRLCFPDDRMPSEIVIFPATPYESRGMEDVRLVRFVDEDGEVRYYGTYTAFDGLRVYPMLLETCDFHSFHVAALSGRYAKNKGMALFPRRIDGHYVMLSRYDGENLFLLRSHNLHVWNVAERLQSPREDWELVQVGNCGSPIETEAGWLVITHGVGIMRQYCIGASLLDLRNPSKVIGRLRQPLLTPTADERVGYVPNVLYSCGSMTHQSRLIIPYAMSDSRISFATVAIRDLVEHLRKSGP